MKVILAEEAKRIKNDNVNSAFFQTSVRVWPQYGRVEIRGVLKTWIGDSKPFTDIKHYILILRRENGVTWLDNFGETDDEKKETEKTADFLLRHRTARNYSVQLDCFAVDCRTKNQRS